MKKAKKRVISLLLCLITIFFLLPAPASAADIVAINCVNFPDASFRYYVAAYLDWNGDGLLTASERASIKYIYVPNWYICDLRGVEYFPNIISLDCSCNQLKTLNLSYNKALQRVNCSCNQLTALNVTGCTALEYLSCEGNRLTALNVTGNPRLSELSCYSNYISTLNIKNNPRLNHAVRKGEKYIAGSRVTYWLSQSVESVSVVFSLVCDQSTALQLTSAAPPVISVQPRNKPMAENETVTFTVSASGEGLTYQWYAVKQPGGCAVLLTGKTSPRLTMTATKAKNGWKFFCVVSGKGGVLYSRAGKLKVLSPPVITYQPRSTGGKAGTKLTYVVRAKGEDLKYQWYYQKPGTNTWHAVSKGTGPVLTLTARLAKNGYKFRCRISNRAGQV